MTGMIRKIFFILALMAFAPMVKAQDGIEIKTPERITRILESMPISNIPQAGQFQCTELSNTILFYTEARDGVTVQLGARLFSQGVRDAYDPVIISFVERLWVELLLRKTTSSQASLLKEYGVRLVLGGYPLGSGSFRQLTQALDVINSINSLTLTTGGNEIDMFMRDAADNSLHIYIPANRDLLFPYDKKEHEEFLIKDLLTNRSGYKQTLPESAEFTKTNNGLLTTGGECYMIDSLRNDIFFGNDKRIVFSSAYPEESMRNMMMGAVDAQKVVGIYLDVTPHTYNRDIKTFRTSMSGFLGYVQKQGFRFYTGSVGHDGEHCQCLLVMFHPVYNYLHMLSVRFTPGQLEQTGERVLKADLSTFIPQHNIKNLFQEK